MESKSIHPVQIHKNYLSQAFEFYQLPRYQFLSIEGEKRVTLCHFFVAVAISINYACGIDTRQILVSETYAKFDEFLAFS